MLWYLISLNKSSPNLAVLPLRLNFNASVGGDILHFGACNGFGSKLDRILLNSQHPENNFTLFNSTKCLKQRITPMSNILCLEHITRSMSISPNDHYIYAPLKASTRCPWLHLGGMVISRQPLLPRAAKQLPKWWIKSLDFILLFISLSFFICFGEEFLFCLH